MIYLFPHRCSFRVVVAVLSSYSLLSFTAGAPEVPQVFAGHLREGGRVVIPVGGRDNQGLMCAQRENGELKIPRPVQLQV
jgi:protein-L-isoaspartate O-methyltransferase